MTIQTVQIENLTVSQLKDLIRETIIEATPNISQNENEYLTRKETAKKLRVSLVTLNDWSRRGLIQSYKIGGQVRYKLAEIEMSLQEDKNLKYRRD